MSTLTTQEYAALAADWAPLGLRGEGLPGRVLAYVVDGADPAVLDTLAENPRNLSVRSDRPGRGFANAFAAPPDAALLLRLGHTYTAVVKSFPWQPRIDETQPPWLPHLLVATRGFTVGQYPHQSQPVPWLDVSLLGKVLELEGHTEEAVIVAALRPDRDFQGLSPLYTELRGFPDAVLRHAPLLRAALSASSLEQAVQAVKVLARGGVPLEPFVDLLVPLALDARKAVRAAAEPPVRQSGASAVPFLEQAAATSRTTGTRHQALRLLASMAGAACRAFLESRLQAEKGATVQLLQELLASLPGAEPDQGELPPVAPVAPESPLTPAALAAFESCVAVVNEGFAAVKADTSRHVPPADLEPITAEQVRSLATALEKGPLPQGRGPLSYAWYSTQDGRRAIQAFLGHPDLTAIQAVRFLSHLHPTFRAGEYEKKYGMTDDVARLLTAYRNRHSPRLTLRELGEVFRVAGLDPDGIARHIFHGWHTPLATWDDEATWPYFAERPALLERVFEVTGDWGDRRARDRAFGIVARFPEPPRRLWPVLWAAALSSAVKERRLGQAALGRAPDRVARCTDALASGKADVRAVAAEWLGRMGEASAALALRKALEKEKNEAAKAAQLVALEALGGDVSPWFDRRTLVAEARGAAARPFPPAVSWFPVEALPTAHWKDTGEEVPLAVWQLWLLQAHALKSAEPGPLLRRHCADMVPEEREAVGQFVLEAWIDFDVRPVSKAEAQQQAEREYAYLARAPLGPGQAREEREELVRDAVRRRTAEILREPSGSAAAHRGLLAVAAACAGGQAAGSVARYLREWYGQRAAQCKALLQMLAWIEHPSAAQLLVGIADRFRTKGIQAEARRLAEALAEERGWTVQDLADRSIPDGGLDAQGVLVLDYGPRQLTARLAGDDLQLFDASGAPLASLPKARRDDDKEKAAAAKRALAAARKEVKATLALQKSRLYEALCLDRSWRVADWRACLLTHPLAGALCRGLVWSASSAGGPDVLVRPLEDGTLTGVDDDAVVLDAAATVRIAHACRVERPTREAWQRHLVDYDVAPLFNQFGREPYVLPEAAREQVELGDLEGHVLNGLALRRKAEELGYLRGAFQGHMFFNDYRKPFPSASLEAVLRFSGVSMMVDDDKTVALLALSFASLARPEEADRHERLTVSLGEVPPVLLSECWNDLRSIAALGPGFHPAWRKTVGWER
jgi:hypothetical protein